MVSVPSSDAALDSSFTATLSDIPETTLKFLIPTLDTILSESITSTPSTRNESDIDDGPLTVIFNQVLGISAKEEIRNHTETSWLARLFDFNENENETKTVDTNTNQTNQTTSPSKILDKGSNFADTDRQSEEDSASEGDATILVS